MKKKIVIGLVIILGILVAVLIWIATHYQNTSTKRPKDKYKGNIEQSQSKTDVLDGALNYIATKPKYKSKYYQGGYPDDEYGVCTDVVINALQYAGYDLKELIDQDIRDNSNDYQIDKPDPNIDFRRVKNQKVYFDHTAKILTTDLEKIEEWQGGDIVVFTHHIGIVSNRRNRNGVPYIIHHANPWQLAFEEDDLENRNDIVGHYRVTE